MIGIYKITSPSNKVYIGQSINIEQRWREHKGCYEPGNSSRLYNSFKSHGFENHIFEVIEECSVELLNERERHYQDFYDVLSTNGLNLILTSTTEKKLIHSEETRDRIRKSVILSNTLEVREKRRNAKLGKPNSLESKIKTSNTLKSRGHKPLVKKGSENGMSRKVINTETGQIFGTIKEAAESINKTGDYLSEKLRYGREKVFKYYNQNVN